VARKPSVGILLGLEPKKGESEDDEEGYENDAENKDSEVDPEVAAQLEKAGISEPEKQAAMVEAFRMCFEQWEREPHEEAEHEGE
jgi:hypothetical protein